jgi:hypothetical protein
MAGWLTALHGEPRARIFASWALVVGHAVLATAYAIPPLSVSRVVVPVGDSVSIVSYIDDKGPYWVSAFGTVAALLAVAAWTRRGLHVAHLVGGAVVTGYATAIWFGVLVSNPNRPIISAVLATLIAAWHLILSSAYAEAVARR